MSSISLGFILEQAAEVLPNTTRELLDESSRLTNGWNKIDKLRLNEIIQSIYHMGWTLKDLVANYHEIAGSFDEKIFTTDGTQIYYDDLEDLDSDELKKRTVDFYKAVKALYSALGSMLTELKKIPMEPYRVSFLKGRLYLDLFFFEKQFEKAFGEKIED